MGPKLSLARLDLGNIESTKWLSVKEGKRSITMAALLPPIPVHPKTRSDTLWCSWSRQEVHPARIGLQITIRKGGANRKKILSECTGGVETAIACKMAKFWLSHLEEVSLQGTSDFRHFRKSNSFHRPNSEIDFS
ncbi:MAG: hypothetical protein ACI97A_001673 [Planctomycetota bacterium]|jgi:hypothetical protein